MFGNLFLLNDETWGDLFGHVLQNPQNYLFWIIILLVILFILSRFNNYLEVRGVDRAIYITRGLVGTFMYFIIVPIVLYLLLNIIALVYGIPTINISFLAQWIGLTITSYWWLLKCFFGSESISGQAEVYSVDAIIRMLWVLLPATLIWLRISKSRIGKLFILPLIIGVFVIAQHKKAPTTFITEDPQIVSRIPMLGWFIQDPDAPVQTDSGLKPYQKQYIIGGLLLFVIIGFAVGLYFKYRLIGVLIVLIGLMGFFLMAPHEEHKVIPLEHHEHYHADIDSLIHRMDSLYYTDGESIEVYDLSLKIHAAYDARFEMGDMIEFPDSLCLHFNNYFYDWCAELQKRK